MSGAVCPLCDELVEGPLCPKDGVPPFRPDAAARVVDVAPGRIIAARYRIEEELGQGTMGTVYRATQLGMQRSVAIKILKPSMLAELTTVKRFYREAWAVSELGHPNIVRVFDFGVDEGVPFLVFELVAGMTVRALLLREKRLPEARAARLMAQVMRALIAAHARNLIHRDLKPENLMVESLPGGGEHLRILDFGVVKIDLGPKLTDAKALVGTPHYMSPEQILGEELDGRSDLYAAGCILHELLSGTPPFAGTNLAAILRAHHRDDPPPIAEIGEPMDALRRALLAKDRAARPASAEAAAIELETIANPPPAVAPPPARWGRGLAAALLAVAIVVAAILFFSQPEELAPAPISEPKPEIVPWAAPKAETPPPPAPPPPAIKKKKKKKIDVW